MRKQKPKHRPCVRRPSLSQRSRTDFPLARLNPSGLCFAACMRNRSHSCRAIMGTEGKGGGPCRRGGQRVPRCRCLGQLPSSGILLVLVAAASLLFCLRAHSCWTDGHSRSGASDCSATGSSHVQSYVNELCRRCQAAFAVCTQNHYTQQTQAHRC